jgi:hypothetical protein
MNEPERVDFSALDPERDPEHWRRVTEATLLRIDAVLDRRRDDALSTIAHWSRPLLVAAAATIAVLVPIEIALETRESRAEQVDRLVSLSSWHQAKRPPSSAEFLRALAERTP